MSAETRDREWDYWPEPDGEILIAEEGTTTVGWHDWSEGQDEAQLQAEFEAYFRGLYPDLSGELKLRPILARTATDVECRINGWEEGTFVKCTPRAKRSWPMWQIEFHAQPQPDGGREQ